MLLNTSYHKNQESRRLRLHKKHEVLQPIMKGKIRGKRGMGRKRITRLGNIRKWTALDGQAVLKITENRNEFVTVIINLRKWEEK